MSKPLWQVMSGYLQPSEPPKGRKERRIGMENHGGYYEAQATCGKGMSDEHAHHSCYRDPEHTDHGRRPDDAHICLCGTVWESRTQQIAG